MLTLVCGCGYFGVGVIYVPCTVIVWARFTLDDDCEWVWFPMVFLCMCCVWLLWHDYMRITMWV